jgi:hypothetical protein
MSARTVATASIAAASATKRIVAPGHQPPKPVAAELQFREDLWRQYRLEAIKAGFSSAQAIEYASALSSEMGQLAGASETLPMRRGWFYQSLPRVVRQTISLRRLELGDARQSKGAKRTAAADDPAFAFGFRWWNLGAGS